MNVLKNSSQLRRVSVSSEDILPGGVIVFDENRNKLIYIDNRKEPVEFVIIDLQRIESCLLQINYRPIAPEEFDKRDVESFVDNVLLRFVVDEPRRIVDIPFYDRRINYVSELPELRSKAHQWKNNVSKLFETRDTASRA